MPFLQFGNVWQNFITVAALVGIGYMIYQKMRGDSKGKEVVAKLLHKVKIEEKNNMWGNKKI